MGGGRPFYLPRRGGKIRLLAISFVFHEALFFTHIVLGIVF